VTASGLRVAIVGAGLMGRYHAQAARRAGATVAAVADSRIERARNLAGEGVAIRALAELDSQAVDVVHVCTPLEGHVTVAEEAIALGAHVVVEKPMTADGASTDALLAAAQARGVLAVPVHQFLFQPGVQRLLAARRRYGSLVRCVFEAATAGAEATGLDRDELVAEILPHPLALFTRLTTSALSEVEWLAVRPSPGELRALADVDGTTFEIVISTRARPTRLTLDVSGTTASAHADLFHGFAVLEHGAGTGVGKILRPFKLGGGTFARAGLNLTRRTASRELAYPGLRELVRRTYDAVATGSPSPIPEREALAVAVARDAILAAIGSRAGGRPD
jgi:predicted dehydrogenase